MKKLLALLLCLTLALSLAACGGTRPSAPSATDTPEPTSTPEPTAEPEPTPEPTSEPITVEASAADAAGPEEEASATDAGEGDAAPLPEIDADTPIMDEAQYEAALACVGRSVEELYEAIGTPPGGSQYAASCLEENAEDGMLHYEGFYVWTVKNESGETVHQVYLSQ